MDIGYFFKALDKKEITFFTGVPDSLLSAFCDEVVRRHGCSGLNHIVSHNEGGAVALAGGHYLATGRVPCVYMQNSGIGNALNPAVSLIHPEVYGIPILFVVGWRGEPGTKDEPQHVFQGKVTLKLLEDIDVEYFVVDMDTPPRLLDEALERFGLLFEEGKSAALVIRKGALGESGHFYKNRYAINRERAVEIVLAASGDDPVVSTTGKISRELFEIRERRSEGHEKDFLTVGSMGHSVMIALGISMELRNRRIWCMDGDGSMLMHMGGIGVVGSVSPENFIHVVFNNAAHESVGGMPTVAEKVDIPAIAIACGYRHAHLAEDYQSLNNALKRAKRQKGPVFIEVRVDLGSRSDLGRPKIETRENRRAFMKYLNESRRHG